MQARVQRIISLSVLKEIGGSLYVREFGCCEWIRDEIASKELNLPSLDAVLSSENVLLELTDNMANLLLKKGKKFWGEFCVTNSS